MAKCIGILTAGGDSPGLNAAIRAIGKSANNAYNMQVIGFRDGFRGLMENRTVLLEGETLSGILTLGGTILGTSRDKPHKMPVGSKVQDMTEVMRDNYHRHNLEALICIGGGGTQKNAWRLAQMGMNVITLPKTIDNDVAMTDITFGFDTALSIATDAIDRLHSTAHSHHRIIVVEIMGHNTGWLGLGAGLASGADVILIPEIPYDVKQVAEAVSWPCPRGRCPSARRVNWPSWRRRSAGPGRTRSRRRPARTWPPSTPARPPAPCACRTSWNRSPAWRAG
jgi:6-phosphofructokinase 1